MAPAGQEEVLSAAVVTREVGTSESLLSEEPPPPPQLIKDSRHNDSIAPRNNKVMNFDNMSYPSKYDPKGQ